MPLAANRKIATMSTEAYKHMEQIVQARRALGQYANNTAYLSELILSQPVPSNTNGHKPQATRRRRPGKSKRRTTAPAHKSRG